MRATRWLSALLVLVVWLAPAAQAATGQHLAEIFERANRANARGELAQAIEGYRRLLEAGVDDPDVYFNLATAHARAEQYGRAILHFERVLALRPGDDEAAEGLRAAEARAAQRHGQDGQAGALSTGSSLPETLARPFPPGVLAVAILVLNLIFFGLLVGRRHLRGDTTRTALGAAAAAAGICLVGAALLLAVQQGVFRKGAPGVVLQPQAVLRDAPDPRAGARGHALEGERVRVLDRHGAYLRVETRAHGRGWMSAEEVEGI